MIARHVMIEGRVQGVGYRAWTAHNATKRGLTGWVRNRTDGSVEAVFQGEAATVEAMIAACWDGPLVSKVTAVKVEVCDVDESVRIFARKDTC